MADGPGLTVTPDRVSSVAAIYATMRVYESRVDRFTSAGADTGGACQAVSALTAEPRVTTLIVSVADVRTEEGWTVSGSDLVFSEPVACDASVEVAYEVTPPCG